MFVSCFRTAAVILDLDSCYCLCDVGDEYSYVRNNCLCQQVMHMIRLLLLQNSHFWGHQFSKWRLWLVWVHQQSSCNAIVPSCFLVSCGSNLLVIASHRFQFLWLCHRNCVIQQALRCSVIFVIILPVNPYSLPV